MKCYSKNNELHRVFKLYEIMRSKNININEKTYGAMLSAAVDNDRIDLALKIIQIMRQNKADTNTIHMTILLKGYCKIKQWNNAFQIFELMKMNTNTYPNNISYHFILEMCLQAKFYNKAYELFKDITRFCDPDLKSYIIIFKISIMDNNFEIMITYLRTLYFYKKLDLLQLIFKFIFQTCLSCDLFHSGIELLIFAVYNELPLDKASCNLAISVFI